MKPRLHPDMGETVLCARVAVQLVYRHYRMPEDPDMTPAQLARHAAWLLPPDHPGFLKFALHSLAVYLDLGMPSATWLQNVLEASHYGSSFRRCFFFAYKAERRSYPRVTNRGVQTSPRRRSYLSQEEGDNA